MTGLASADTMRLHGAAIPATSRTQGGVNSHQRLLIRHPIRAGLVGCGRWGGNVALAIDGSHLLDLAAVADSDRRAAIQQASRSQSRPQVAATDDLLMSDRVDAVFIVTDAVTHFELASTALRNGKHVFVEKPLALSSEECRQLVDLAEQVGRTLMVGHTFLYSDYVVAVDGALRDGLLGGLRYVHMQRLAYGRFRSDADVVWNLGPHDVSILMHWARRPPVAVRCTAHRFHRRLSDLASLTLDFDDYLAHVQLSTVDPKKVRRATLAGTAAGIVYDDVAGDVQLLANGAGAPVRLAGPIERQPLDVEIDHFASCVVTGARPRTDGVHGAWVVAVLEAATTSARSGGDRVVVRPPFVGPTGYATAANSIQHPPPTART